MSLFGNVGATSTTAGQTNTTGDISKDVPLNSPPEDGISDLRFSPASEHLAVASWDKKVRIYEINEQGQSEGKALFEHEAPVLNCCWSPVKILLLVMCFLFDLLIFVVLARMERKLSELAPTKLHACWTSQPTLLLPFKSLPTMLLSGAVI
jgi:WD40 repeat protein